MQMEFGCTVGRVSDATGKIFIKAKNQKIIIPPPPKFLQDGQFIPKVYKLSDNLRSSFLPIAENYKKALDVINRSENFVPIFIRIGKNLLLMDVNMESMEILQFYIAGEIKGLSWFAYLKFNYKIKKQHAIISFLEKYGYLEEIEKQHEIEDLKTIFPEL